MTLELVGVKNSHLKRLGDNKKNMNKLLGKGHVYERGFPGESILSSLNHRRHDYATSWLSFNVLHIYEVACSISVFVMQNYFVIIKF